MAHHKFSIFYVLVLFIGGCARENPSPINPDPLFVNNIGDNPTIYTTGVSEGVAISWKNGIADTLNANAWTQSVFVSNDDIYVAGWMWGSNNRAIATYWKNGKPIFLSDSSKNTYAQSIVVSGKDVYVVGYEMQSNLGSPSIAKCWKNGAVTSFSTTGSGSVAVAAFVAGSNIYVAGWQWFPNKQAVATYWKNGSPTSLTDGSSPSMATSIFVSGSDVYVAGTVNYELANVFPVGEIHGLGKEGIATYWKNDNPVELSNNGRAQSIFVNGNDVYVAGSIYSSTVNDITPLGNVNGDLAVYWKNSVLVNLIDNNLNSLASSISVTANGDVYTAGTIDNQAVYWKNNSVAKTFSPTITGGGSYLNSIFLTN